MFVIVGELLNNIKLWLAWLYLIEFYLISIKLGFLML